MKPTIALRKLIEQPGITMAIGVYDPLTARLAQKAGFKLLVISGNAVSASYLGMPDMGFLNLHDIVDVSRRIAAAVDIPVIVDADTGFGNAMNVVRTVRELEGSGTAGIIIEDQIEYKKCGMIERKHPVVPAEEHAAKVKAASLTKTDPDFFIIARTDAEPDFGIQEAIRRAHLYTEAGADMLDIEVLGTPEQLTAIKAANFSLPLTANMDEGKRLWKYDLPTLQAAGYRIASYPGVVRYTVVRAVMESLDYLKREGSSAGIVHKMSTVKEWFDTVDLDRYLEMEKDLLQPFHSRKGGPVIVKSGAKRK